MQCWLRVGRRTEPPATSFFQIATFKFVTDFRPEVHAEPVSILKEKVREHRRWMTRIPHASVADLNRAMNPARKACDRCVSRHVSLMTTPDSARAMNVRFQWPTSGCAR